MIAMIEKEDAFAVEQLVPLKIQDLIGMGNSVCFSQLENGESVSVASRKPWGRTA